MIKNILDALQLIETSDNELIQIALGKNKYPENWSELKNAVKTLKNKKDADS